MKLSALNDLLKRWEEEAKEYDSLQKLWTWFKSRSKEIWEPYYQQIHRQIQAGVEISADVRNKIAERLGCHKKQIILHRIYETMVKELMGKSAERLIEPNSDDHKEIIEKYNKVWQELAKR